jgi:hypothetical protein
MPYTLTIDLVAPTALAGKNVTGFLIDTSGVEVVAPTQVGMVEIGFGMFQWTTSIPDGFRGSVVFSDADNVNARYGVAAINPQETENTDVKTSHVTSVGGGGTVTVTPQDPVGDGTFQIIRYNTFIGTLENFVPSITWEAIYFTVKDRMSQPDASAVVQIKLSNPADPGDGLQVLDGATPGDKSWGFLVYDDQNDKLTISLADDATSLLPLLCAAPWDVKVIDAIGGNRVGYGTIYIEDAVTQTLV